MEFCEKSFFVLFLFELSLFNIKFAVLWKQDTSCYFFGKFIFMSIFNKNWSFLLWNINIVLQIFLDDDENYFLFKIQTFIWTSLSHAVSVLYAKVSTQVINICTFFLNTVNLFLSRKVKSYDRFVCGCNTFKSFNLFFLQLYFRRKDINRQN